MKIEDLVVINKGELEKILIKWLDLHSHQHDYWHNQDTVEEILKELKSKPLKGFVEDAFEAGFEEYPEIDEAYDPYSVEFWQEGFEEAKENYLKQEIKW